MQHLRKIHKLVLLFILLVSTDLYAQILIESKLPIVKISTQGQQIPDEPKINGTMEIVFNGEGKTNRISEIGTHYRGNIGIETRGNSTQDFDKKTYSIELRTDQNQDTSLPLLGLGSEEDWILHAMVIDKSQVRIPYSFYLFQRMGHYAAHWRYVELVLNGDYRGLYILTERIKRDKNRVDIAKLKKSDISGDELTGGYILRIDWLEDDPAGFESNFSAQGGYPMFYQWYYPKATDVQPQQATYIQDWMGKFESAVFAADYKNSEQKRYTDYIDLNSFVDFVIINELSKNADGYKLSSYLHKQKDSEGGKLVAGPIWDFDQTYGVSEVCSNADPTGWTYLQNLTGCEDLESMPLWWKRMMDDLIFQERLKCRWNSFRQTFLHRDSINKWINEDTSLISKAIARNFTKWDNFIGEAIWIEPEPIPQSYAEEIQVLQKWITDRITWLDANMPGECNTNSISKLNSLDIELVVYPNPTRNTINVRTKNLERLTLLNLNGQQMAESSEASIDVNHLPAGLYFLRVETRDFVTTRKVIKE